MVCLWGCVRKFTTKMKAYQSRMSGWVKQCLQKRHLSLSQPINLKDLLAVHTIKCLQQYFGGIYIYIYPILSKVLYFILDKKTPRLTACESAPICSEVLVRFSNCKPTKNQFLHFYKTVSNVVSLKNLIIWTQLTPTS